MEMKMDDEAVSALLKTNVDPGDVTAPPETVSVVMRTIAVVECLKALAELYLLAPLEILDRGLNGREGRKEA
ncbi:MAG: hypothetical protein JSW71_06110 [Gemmatimonadota bacterium]|nr:MAG: hypothetical protein JSW71_06110 [Gemmatimonadota bacterium]